MLSPDTRQPAESPSSTEPIDDLCDAETSITELTFLPDGRICLFGASREVLEVLGSLNLGDASLDSRLAAVRRAATES
jgi:hypothetical protein